eukprot:TRINITY_DN4508_c0_g2_i4.p1 TRINITY_DN4508_c0_g2~~TRINITY_DN4508_c0_g2_i4.p1  ORF type:complete len:198 (-),score=25.47 TRINITY_DN4508_c0_g2_i4:127-720(-)
MIRRPPRSTQGVSSAASDVYKRQDLLHQEINKDINVTFPTMILPFKQKCSFQECIDGIHTIALVNKDVGFYKYYMNSQYKEIIESEIDYDKVKDTDLIVNPENFKKRFLDKQANPNQDYYHIDPSFSYSVLKKYADMIPNKTMIQQKIQAYELDTPMLNTGKFKSCTDHDLCSSTSRKTNFWNDILHRESMLSLIHI